MVRSKPCVSAMAFVPVRFQAAFGRGTRGQQVPTLRGGVVCTHFRLGCVGYAEWVGVCCLCVQWFGFRRVDALCLCVFQAAFGGERVGSECPLL